VSYSYVVVGIVAVDNSRLFIQVLSIENKRHRRRCYAKKVETILSEEKGLSPAIKSVVELLVSRLNLDGRNSSKPPSSDPNRKKVGRAKGGKKATWE